MSVQIMDRSFRPVSAAPLAAFRIAFGALASIEIGYLLLSGQARIFSDELLHFTYYGFDWIRPPPGALVYWLFGIAAVAALFVAMGLFYRVSAVIFFLSWSHIFFIEKSVYLNHFYLILLLALILPFVPAAGIWSIDAWRRRAPRAATVPAWSLRLLQFQIALPYVYGGIAKVDADWLRAMPMRIWLEGYTRSPILPYVFAYGGLLFDLCIVPCLFVRRTRPYALAAMLFFHLMNAFLFDIDVFPWLMIAGTYILLRPETRSTGPAGREKQTMRRTAGVWLIGLYACFQLLFPLRHFLYPGDAKWTNEGHWFSWRMLLRVKEARAEFIILDRQRMRAWSVDPRTSLAPKQADVMPNDPDMTLQFARTLKEKFRADGFENIEVHANISASLNGRPFQPFVDPEVDLAAEPRGLRHKTWIVPLSE